MANRLQTVGFLFICFLMLVMTFSFLPELQSPTGQIVGVESPSTCTDTDGGRYYKKYGHAYTDSQSGYDQCLNETVLLERFCNADYVDRIIVNCNCKNGMCI